MKNLLPLFAIILLAACSKDQKAINHLNGSWTMTTLTVDGIDYLATEEGNVYQFNHCKVKNGPCDGGVVNNGETVRSFTMSVSDKANKYEKVTFVPEQIFINPYTQEQFTTAEADTITEIGDIVTISKTTFHTKYTNSLGNAVEKIYTKN